MDNVCGAVVWNVYKQNIRFANTGKSHIKLFVRKADTNW